MNNDATFNPEQAIEDAIKALTTRTTLRNAEVTTEDRKEIRRLKRLIRAGTLPRYQVKRVKTTSTSGRLRTELRLVDTISVIMGSRAIDSARAAASSSSASAASSPSPSSEPPVILQDSVPGDAA